MRYIRDNLQAGAVGAGKVLLLYTRSDRMRVFIEDYIRGLMGLKDIEVLRVHKKGDWKEVKKIRMLPTVYGRRWLVIYDAGKYVGKEDINVLVGGRSCQYLGVVSNYRDKSKVEGLYKKVGVSYRLLYLDTLENKSDYYAWVGEYLGGICWENKKGEIQGEDGGIEVYGPSIKEDIYKAYRRDVDVMFKVVDSIKSGVVNSKEELVECGGVSEVMLLDYYRKLIRGYDGVKSEQGRKMRLRRFIKDYYLYVRELGVYVLYRKMLYYTVKSIEQKGEQFSKGVFGGRIGEVEVSRLYKLMGLLRTKPWYSEVEGVSVIMNFLTERSLKDESV